MNRNNQCASPIGKGAGSCLSPTWARVSLRQMPPAVPHFQFLLLPEHRDYTSQPPLQRGVATELSSHQGEWKGSTLLVDMALTPSQT